MGKDLIKDAGVARLKSSVHRVPEILTGQATLLAVIRERQNAQVKRLVQILFPRLGSLRNPYTTHTQ